MADPQWRTGICRNSTYRHPASLPPVSPSSVSDSLDINARSLSANRSDDHLDGVEVARAIEAGQVAERSGQRQQARVCYERALHLLSAHDAGAQATEL